MIEQIIKNNNDKIGTSKSIEFPKPTIYPILILWMTALCKVSVFEQVIYTTSEHSIEHSEPMEAVYNQTSGGIF